MTLSDVGIATSSVEVGGAIGLIGICLPKFLHADRDATVDVPRAIASRHFRADDAE
jgi:hypothetical protein